MGPVQAISDQLLNTSISMNDTPQLQHSNPSFIPTTFSEITPVSNIPSMEPQNKEKDRIHSRLDGFNPKDNEVWKVITSKFGPNIKQPELLSIASVCAQNANLKLDRDAKRRKSVLIKWFYENWAAISPYLDFVVLEDAHQIQPQQN